MTLLATYLAEQRDPPAAVLSLAKEFVAKALIPPRLTRAVLLKYVTRAKRNGAWRTLTKEAKALLLAATKVITEAKSPTLKKALKEALLQIELATLKGIALLHGAIQILKHALYPLISMLNKVTEVLCLGILIINNPYYYDNYKY